MKQTLVLANMTDAFASIVSYTHRASSLSSSRSTNAIRSLRFWANTSSAVRVVGVIEAT